MIAAGMVYYMLRWGRAVVVEGCGCVIGWRRRRRRRGGGGKLIQGLAPYTTGEGRL